MRGDLIDHGVPERLHPVESVAVLPVDAERNQLIKPWHQQADTILPESHQLGGFGVDRVGDALGCEAILHQVDVLPEELIQNEIQIKIDHGHRDVPLGLSAAEHVRPEQQHITDPRVLLAKLAIHERRSIAHDDELHAIIGGRVDGRMECPRARK